MALPLYVLLPDGAEWTEVPGTIAQSPSSIRWYLRQFMPQATTQTAVLVGEETVDAGIDAVVARAHELGGVVVDAGTQHVVERAADVVT